MYITIINYLKKNLLLLLTILCAGMLASCSDADTSSKEQSGTPLIILDTDIGSSTDDLYAKDAANGSASSSTAKDRNTPPSPT